MDKLTREKVESMKAGREMDALVAERVMGLNVVARDWPCGPEPECGSYDASFSRGEPMSWHDEKGPVIYNGDLFPEEDEFVPVKPVKFYSTDTVAALEVIEKITNPEEYEPTIVRIAGPFCDGWYVGLYWQHHDGEIPELETSGETLPFAISRLALLLKANNIWD